MKLFTYLNFDGNCREALTFYEQHLGGKITMITTHGEGPAPGRVPAGWEKAVLHARINVGGTALLGADIPGAQPVRSSYLTLIVNSSAEAERVYAVLSESGQVLMPMEETFFAARFAQVRDRFGVSWMILQERPGLPQS